MINKIDELLKNNSYPGRGIIIGKTADDGNAVAAYFIMGRSENSRNRVFAENNDAVFTRPFDASRVTDPSLIIYPAIRRYKNNLIVTNGDQTDTVYEALSRGESFFGALKTREFEPDSPNFTPRISGVLVFNNGDFEYKMSILKCVDGNGLKCARYLFEYPSVLGTGRFMHTYSCDGNPLPSFSGEPVQIGIDNDIGAFTDKIWNALNAENKISLYVRYINLSTGKETNRLVNKNK